MGKLPKLSIRAKILSITLILLFLSGITSGLISSYFFAKEYSAALESKALTIGRNIHYQLNTFLKSDIPLNEVVGFEKQLRETVRQYPEVSAAMVVASDGRIVFHSDQTSAGSHVSDTIVTQELKAGHEGVFYHRDNTIEHKHVDVVVPIYDNQARYIGAVLLNVPTSVIGERVQSQFVIAIVVASVTALLAAFLLSFALRQYVTKHLEVLVNFANEIREKHDFSQRVPQNSSDEFGTLAAAFNQMASELQLQYSNLESKVNEQTFQLAQKVEEVDRGQAKDNALLESIGEGLVVTDTDSKIVMMNSIAANYFNVNLKEVLGKTSHDILHLQDMRGNPIPSDELPSMLSLKKKQKIVQTYTVLRSLGNLISLQVTATPVVQNEKIVGNIMVMLDITREVEIDHMKTEFIYLAAHQLRTPISAIKWFIEMLRNGDAGPLNEEQKEFADNIAEASEQMVQLVTSLLNIARLESGRMVIDPKPTDLNDLIKQVVKEMRSKIDEKQLTVIVSAYTGLPTMKLDPNLISHVYHNLLSNAIKYTPKKGEISVIISRDKDEIVSRISDNGYGIPKNQQNKVFKKFFRADNIAKIEPDGTGLGLYLTKSIIEHSEGKIWFQSEEGKGTSFWFTLPISGMKPRLGEVALDVHTTT